MMFASKAPVSGELYSLNGRVLVHDNRAELEWLMPQTKTVPLPGETVTDVAARLNRPVMLWKDHPDMAGIAWPLRRKDFL